MDSSTILIGVAVVVVGYLAYQSLKPPPPAVATGTSSSSSSSSAGLLATVLGSSTANDIGSALTQRFTEALAGERDWW